MTAKVVKEPKTKKVKATEEKGEFVDFVGKNGKVDVEKYNEVAAEKDLK